MVALTVRFEFNDIPTTRTTMYVIRRNEDGMYVAPPGSHKSYTRSLERAHTFPTRAAAEADACGNETVYALTDLVGRR